jgi:hypothetical protein
VGARSKQARSLELLASAVIIISQAPTRASGEREKMSGLFWCERKEAVAVCMCGESQEYKDGSSSCKLWPPSLHCAALMAGREDDGGHF